ncbi:hypothetical protein ACIOJF_14060 [Glutamicibacter sp. NPDC087831]|uniref:hypothetical protein n=1 Tax=Glutamicibacter sp. NPDC087831 TaxID=3363998 RepID=UPI0037F1D407
MSHSQNPLPDEAAELLSQAERSSADSVHSTAAPRAFMIVLGIVSAAIISLYGVIDTALWHWSPVLFAPLIAWYALWARQRPKRRPALKHSGKYIAVMLLMMLALQFSNFWMPQTWLFAILKFLALVAVFTGALWIMRRETIKSRIKDGNEQAI